MAPIIFNIYTNDQLIKMKTEHFIYTNDLAELIQETNFKIVENKKVHTKI